MNISAKEYPNLQHVLSFHLSHQPPVYVLIKFYIVKLVLIELTHIVKSESTRTEAVEGSNESSEHPDEELHPHLQKYSPLQKNFKTSSVGSNCGAQSEWACLVSLVHLDVV